MTPEGKVKARVRATLKKAGAYAFMPVQTGLGATTLDLLVCINGQFLAIETKAEKGQITPRQWVVADAIVAAGGWAIFVRGLDGAKEFEQWLLQYPEQTKH